MAPRTMEPQTIGPRTTCIADDGVADVGVVANGAVEDWRCLQWSCGQCTFPKMALQTKSSLTIRPKTMVISDYGGVNNIVADDGH